MPQIPNYSVSESEAEHFKFLSLKKTKTIIKTNKTNLKYTDAPQCHSSWVVRHSNVSDKLHLVTFLLILQDAFESTDQSVLAPLVPGSDSALSCNKLCEESVVQQFCWLWHWWHGCVGQETSATEVAQKQCCGSSLPPQDAWAELCQGWFGPQGLSDVGKSLTHASFEIPASFCKSWLSCPDIES